MKCKGSLELEVMHLLRTKFRHVQTHLASTLHCAKLTPIQYNILEVLYLNQRMSIGDVMNKVSSTKGNMTVVIKNMLEHGWIYRSESTTDKRKADIWLSESGIALVESYIPIYTEAVHSMYEAFDEQELNLLSELLNKIKTKEG